MTISATTIGLLIDAGLAGETLKAVTAAIETDVTNACNSVRNAVTLSDAGSVTPAALRMRKMRKKEAETAQNTAVAESVTERNEVTKQSVTDSVTSDNNLSLEGKGIEEGKKVRNARARKTYPSFFARFWSVFPNDPGMSKSEALKAWDRLAPAEQQDAIDAIPAFKIWAANQGDTYRLVHACRYLSQRRFEGFKDQFDKWRERGLANVYVKSGTPAYRAWTEFYNKKSCHVPRDSNGGWWFPSEFPPTEGATQ